MHARYCPGANSLTIFITLQILWKVRFGIGLILIKLSLQFFVRGTVAMDKENFAVID